MSNKLNAKTRKWNTADITGLRSIFDKRKRLFSKRIKMRILGVDQADAKYQSSRFIK
jgi:hypothetical protein